MSLICNLDYIYSIARACPSFTGYLSKVIDFLCNIDYKHLTFHSFTGYLMQLLCNSGYVYPVPSACHSFTGYKNKVIDLFYNKGYIPGFSLIYRVSNAPSMKFSLYKPCSLVYNSFTGYLCSVCAAHRLSLRVFFSELFFFTFIFNSFRSPRLGSIRL